MLYWQWNCDSSWYTFENISKKVILKSCPSEPPAGCNRLGLRFIKEFDSILLFIYKSVSGCCQLPTVLFFDKSTCEEKQRISDNCIVHIDYEHDVLMYFEDTTYQKLIYHDLKRNTKYCTIFYGSEVISSLKNNQALWLNTLFSDFAIKEGNCRFYFKNDDRVAEERFIDLTRPETPFTSDANRLFALHYMELAPKVNCDSTGGSNLEHKICLNKEFQEVDSLLNMTFNKVLAELPNDSLKTILHEIQLDWITSRQEQAKIASSGYGGHILGIKYLSFMITATKGRIEELKEFLIY